MIDPKASDWRSRAIPVPNDDWRSRALPVNIEVPGTVESIVRGGAQGVTLGFAPAITGRLEASLDHDPESYAKHRQESLNTYEEARTAHPYAYGAGELVGSIGPALLAPGSAITKAIGLSAVAGLGNSKADITKGEYLDAAKDTLISGVAGGVLHTGGETVAKYAGPIITKAANKAKELAGNVGKQVLSIGFGPDVEAITDRLAGRARATGESFSKLGDRLSEAVNKYDESITSDTESARNLLSKNADPLAGGIDRDRLVSVINQAREDLKKGAQDLVGNSALSTDSVLEGYANKLSNHSDYISEYNLKGILDQIRKDINWKDKSASTKNETLTSIQKSFDAVLKDNIPFQEAQSKVNEKVKTLNKLKTLFNLEREHGEDLAATNATSSSLKSSLNKDMRAKSKEALDRLKQATGDDLHDSARDYLSSMQFQKGYTNGSRNAQLWGSIGGGTAGYVFGHNSGAAALGMMAGKMAGATIDKRGGQIAGQLIDWWAHPSRVAALGKFAAPISEAAQRGPAALASTHYILQQTSGEYRKTLNALPALEVK
jgi:hypothetical protein